MLTLKSTVALLLIGCNMWYFKIGVNIGLSESATENNATEVYNFLKAENFTDESICGILGNMQYESYLNPGCKHSERGAWGLIQWNPHSVLTDWASDNEYNWWDGAAQMIFITGDDVVNYIPTSRYPYTWKEFSQLTNTTTAARAYWANRERSESYDDMREIYADRWYHHFTDTPPTPEPPTPPTPPHPIPPSNRTGMPLWMYLRPNYYF